MSSFPKTIPTQPPLPTHHINLPIRPSRPTPLTITKTMPVEYPTSSTAAADSSSSTCPSSNLTCPSNSLEKDPLLKNSKKDSTKHHHRRRSQNTTATLGSFWEGRTADEMTALHRVLREFLLSLPGASLNGLGYQ